MQSQDQRPPATRGRGVPRRGCGGRRLGWIGCRCIGGGWHGCHRPGAIGAVDGWLRRVADTGGCGRHEDIALSRHRELAVPPALGRSRHRRHHVAATTNTSTPRSGTDRLIMIGANIGARWISRSAAEGGRRTRARTSAAPRPPVESSTTFRRGNFRPTRTVSQDGRGHRRSAVTRSRTQQKSAGRGRIAC